jgi:tRNA-splicing endonuclease subunit Sen34
MQVLIEAAEERKKAFRNPKASLKDGETGGEEAEGIEDVTEEKIMEEPLSIAVFESSTKPKTNPNSQDFSPTALRYYPVPSTSIPLYHSLPPPTSPSESSSLAPTPPKTSYPLYKHLHANSYFLSPGLRFGCQFMAYPGDPLRFHSHFVVTGMGWDEEIEMRDIVGGGRLGTGVKKAWMVGGEDKDKPGVVRTFCVEWGGF